MISMSSCVQCLLGPLFIFGVYATAFFYRIYHNLYLIIGFYFMLRFYASISTYFGFIATTPSHHFIQECRLLCNLARIIFAM